MSKRERLIDPDQPLLVQCSGKGHYLVMSFVQLEAGEGCPVCRAEHEGTIDESGRVPLSNGKFLVLGSVGEERTPAYVPECPRCVAGRN